MSKSPSLGGDAHARACARLGARHRAGAPRAWLGAALLAAPALAVPASIPTTAPMLVTASVVRGCIVSGAPQQTTGVPFGRIDFGTHPAVGAASVTALAGGGGLQARIECTPGTQAHISANAGLHPQGGQRRMSNNAGQFIAYSLALAGAVAAPLPPDTVVDLPLGAAATALPLVGTASLPGSGLAAGLYTDTVQVTLTW